MTEDSPETKTPHLERIGQIMVPVVNLERALAFYRDVMGLTFLFEVPGMAFFEVGGVRLMLARSDAADRPVGSGLYYKVADIDRDYAALCRKGAIRHEEPHFIAKMPDHDLWMGFLRDSEGNVFALMCEKSRV